MTEKLKADFLKSGQDFVSIGGKDHNEDPLGIAQSNAQGWGGMPVELGVSNIYRNTQQFYGSVCQAVTFKEPDNKYFTSITLYDEAGYMIDSSRVLHLLSASGIRRPCAVSGRVCIPSLYPAYKRVCK